MNRTTVSSHAADADKGGRCFPASPVSFIGLIADTICRLSKKCTTPGRRRDAGRVVYSSAGARGAAPHNNRKGISVVCGTEAAAGGRRQTIDHLQTRRAQRVDRRRRTTTRVTRRNRELARHHLTTARSVRVRCGFPETCKIDPMAFRPSPVARGN